MNVSIYRKRVWNISKELKSLVRMAEDIDRAVDKFPRQTKEKSSLGQCRRMKVALKRLQREVRQLDNVRSFTSAISEDDERTLMDGVSPLVAMSHKIRSNHEKK